MSSNNRIARISDRGLAALALTTAILAATAAWYATEDTAVAPGERLRTYIPHDTTLFIGTLSGVMPGPRFSAWRDALRPLAAAAETLEPARIASDLGPALAVLAGVLQQLASATTRSSDAWPMAPIGLPPGGVFAAYTVAGVPVVRWELADSAALRRTLAKAERNARRPVASDTVAGLRLWRYPFGTKVSRRVELIVAVGEGFALATLDSPRIGVATLKAALGLEKPASPLDVVHLETLTAAHGLIPGTVGFIDNELVVEALTRKRRANLAKLVDGFARAPYTVVDESLPGFRGAACRERANAVTDLWPRTAIGISAVSPEDGPTALRLVGAIANQRVLANLEYLGGVVPEAVRASPGGILSVGVGLQLSTLLRSVEGMEAGEQPATAVPRCPAFVAAQQWLIKAALALRKPFAALAEKEQGAGDIQGVGLVLFGSASAGAAPWWMPAAGLLAFATSEPGATRQQLWPIFGIDSNISPAGPHAGAHSGGIFSDGVRVVSRDDELVFSRGVPELPGEESATGSASSLQPRFDLRYRHAPLAKFLTQSGAKRSNLTPAQRSILGTAAGYLRASGVDVEAHAGIVDAGVELDVSARAPNGVR